jgi:hypothetical protein
VGVHRPQRVAKAARRFPSPDGPTAVRRFSCAGKVGICERSECPNLILISSKHF